MFEPANSVATATSRVPWNNAGLNGLIFADLDACFVMMTALPFGSTRALKDDPGHPDRCAPLPKRSRIYSSEPVVPAFRLLMTGGASRRAGASLSGRFGRARSRRDGSMPGMRHGLALPRQASRSQKRRPRDDGISSWPGRPAFAVPTGTIVACTLLTAGWRAWPHDSGDIRRSQGRRPGSSPLSGRPTGLIICGDVYALASQRLNAMRRTKDWSPVGTVVPNA
jgi:hypothetical protein